MASHGVHLQYAGVRACPEGEAPKGPLSSTKNFRSCHAPSNRNSDSIYCTSHCVPAGSKLLMMIKNGNFWVIVVKSLTLYSLLLVVSFLFVDWFSVEVSQIEYVVRFIFVLPGFLLTFPFFSDCWLGSFMNGPGAPTWCPSLYGLIGSMVVVSAITYSCIFAWMSKIHLGHKLVALLEKSPFGKEATKQ